MPTPQGDITSTETWSETPAEEATAYATEEEYALEAELPAKESADESDDTEQA